MFVLVLVTSLFTIITIIITLIIALSRMSLDLLRA
jgi:hypothetical protein